MTVFIGIDPGISATGYGIIRSGGGRLEPVARGVIAAPRSRPFEQRLLFIHRQLLEVLDRFPPQAAAVEAVFHARNARSAFQLAQVRGVVLLAAASRELPVSEYAPREVKKAVVGYGAAEKEQVQRMVARMLGLGEDELPADAADALALAICHAHTAATLERQGLREARLGG